MAEDTSLSSPSEAIPAATVVIFRNDPAGGPPQLLMVQRAKEMRFAGGAAVFPGGRVDPADRTLAARLAPDAHPAVAAARVAGIRETLEETGLAIALRQRVSPEDVAAARAMLIEQGELAPVLERFRWDLDLDSLELFAHWCPNFHRAFDTRFFTVNLGTGDVDIAVDATENTRLFWASASGALALADAGEISIIFPTRRNLERLGQFSIYEDVIRDARAYPAQVIAPHKEDRDGEQWLMIPENLGYPVTGQPIATAEQARPRD